MIATKTLDSNTIEDIVKLVITTLQPITQEQEEPENYTPDITVKTYKAFEDYPDILSKQHVNTWIMMVLYLK